MTTSSPTSTPLIGLRVLVTRPAAQADALVAHLQAAGAEVRRLPLLTIQPPPDTATAAAQLADQSKADLWIFTSANAVRGAQTLLDAARWQPDKILAIGAATAQVLAALGHAAECPPADSATSEGLLQLPRLQALAGQRIAIVTGSGGRDGLRASLQARGAMVTVIEVYRREPVRYAPDTLAAQLDSVQALLLTSGEALQALHAQLPERLRATVMQQPLLVPSARVAALAGQLGFSRVIVPAAVSNTAYLEALGTLGIMRP